MNFSQLKRHFEESDRLAQLLGIKVEEAHRGYARLRMELEEKHRNGVGLAHGGVIFTLADVAFAVAANAEHTSAALSAQTSLSFLRMGEKGPLTAEAHTLHDGRTLVVVDVEIRDGSAKLLATARITGARTSLALLPQDAENNIIE